MTPEELQALRESLKEPGLVMAALRDPADAKTDKDYLRLSFKEEDEAFLKDQESQTRLIMKLEKIYIFSP